MRTSRYASFQLGFFEKEHRLDFRGTNRISLEHSGLQAFSFVAASIHGVLAIGFLLDRLL